MDGHVQGVFVGTSSLDTRAVRVSACPTTTTADATAATAADKNTVWAWANHAEGGKLVHVASGLCVDIDNCG